MIDNPQKEGETIGTTLLLKFLSSLLSYIIIISISFIIDKNETLTKTIVCIYSIYIMFQIFETFKYWFQSKLKSKYPEIATTIAYIIMAGYKIILLAKGKSVEWFAIANTIEYIVIAILLYYLYKKNKGQKLNINFKRGKNILLRSYHFVISGMMVALYNSTDKFMLKRMLTDSDVGYYAVAVSISNLATFLLSAIIQSLTPVIMETYKNDNQKYKKLNKQLYCIVFYISAFISIVIFVFSKFIINILYGDKYSLAILPLNILTWYTAFSYLGVARDVWLVCENKQKYSKYIYIYAAIANVIINYLLIPIWGAAGAALASLITQIGTIFIFPLFIKELRPNVKLMIDGILFKNVKRRFMDE